MRNEAVLRRAMDAITDLDADGVLACLTQDAAFQLPYEDALTDLDRNGFGELLRWMFTSYERFTITVTHVYEVVGGDTLIARYEGDCLSRNGVPYANRYLGIFEFRDGRIAHWREYANPLISREAVAADAAAAGRA
jgi:uncharacterized protein